MEHIESPQVPVMDSDQTMLCVGKGTDAELDCSVIESQFAKAFLSAYAFDTGTGQ